MIILKAIIKFINDFLFALTLISLGFCLLINLDFTNLKLKNFETIFLSMAVFIWVFFILLDLFTTNKEKLAKEFDFEYAQDIFIFKIIKNFKIILTIFIFVITIIVLFDVFEYRNKYIYNYVISEENYFVYISYYFIIIFINFSIYMLGYSIIGEYFQRKFGKPKKLLLIDLILDYIFSIPFIIILCTLYLIFLIAPKKADKLQELLSKISLFGLYLTFKYFTYLNLAVISFEDKRFYQSIIESKKFYIKYMKEFVKIYLDSGLMFASLVLLGFSIISINIKFDLVNLNNLIFYYGLFLFIYILFRLFSEQVMVLILYLNKTGIKDKMLFYYKK